MGSEVLQVRRSPLHDCHSPTETATNQPIPFQPIWRAYPAALAKEGRTVPLRACDREGDLGEAVIGLAVPGKAISHHPLRPSIPLPAAGNRISGCGDRPPNIATKMGERSQRQKSGK